jgi:hypothetical protein
MLRSILAVVAGNILWTVLWLGLNAVLASLYPQSFDGKSRIESVPLLLFILLCSVVLSVIAGYLTALIARRSEMAHAFALGLLQLALGIFFQTQSWNLLPVWYHLTFLALLIPANLLGGQWRLMQKTKARRPYLRPA